MQDEDELFFTRFPKEKQEQVRGLVQYATLIGLTGKDLVSIGGKLDRIKARYDKEQKMSIIRGYQCLPIGKDTNDEVSFSHRFKLKTPSGAYNFTRAWNCRWSVYSLRTRVTFDHHITNHEYFGKMGYKVHERYCLLWDIHTGALQLNF